MASAVQKANRNIRPLGGAPGKLLIEVIVFAFCCGYLTSERLQQASGRGERERESAQQMCAHRQFLLALCLGIRIESTDFSEFGLHFIDIRRYNWAWGGTWMST